MDLSKIFGGTKGTWNVGGFVLPDYGLTEAKSGGGSNFQNPAIRYSTPTAPSKGTLGATSSSINVPSVSSITNSGGNSTTSTGGSGGQDINALFKQFTGGDIAPVGWQPPDVGKIEGQINSGYDSYFSELDNMLNEGLPSQRAAQEGIAQSQYNQGVNTLTSQRDSGLRDLGTERTKAQASQSKTLKDLSNNISNLFQAGNVYLGARGAADSSAANQYAYALTKLGSKQRGDVTSQYADIQNDISGREFKLNEIFNTESKNLQETFNQKIGSIAQWFGEQQNALKQAKAQGQLSKSQDLASLSQNLLNTALQQLQFAQQEAANRRAALEEWAMNNSQNISQLASNLGQVANYSFTAPTAPTIAGTPQLDGQGNFAFAPTGFGSNSEQKLNIFGQPIR